MSKFINKLNKLLHYLPDKDKEIGKQYLYNRKFEKLRDLVGSAIYREISTTDQDNKISDNVPYLMSLKTELDIYLLKTDLTFSNDEDYNYED